MWSYGKLGVPAPRLVSAALRAATAPGSEWKLRDLVDLLWGCARLGHTQPHEAFEALGRRACAALNGGGAFLLDV